MCLMDTLYQFFPLAKNVIDRKTKISYFPFNTSNTSRSSPRHQGYMNINDNSSPEDMKRELKPIRKAENIKMTV